MICFRKFNFLYKLSQRRILISPISCNFVPSFSMLTVSKEFSIPFPGGHIAAKSWGMETGRPVLALHGWQDNLGTFDPLIPLLPNDLHIVTFDFLGHGLSSHKPPGTFYNYMDMLIEIKRVVDYLKWERFSFLSHSLGGTLALLYGSIFPDSVFSLICLDIIKPTSRQPDRLPSSTRSAIQQMLQFESKLNNTAPVYSLDAARTRLMKGTVEAVTTKAADVFLIRGAKPSPANDGVVFTRDIRVKVTEGIHLFSHEDVKAYLCNLKCHLLIIIAEDSKIYMSRNPEVIDDIIAIYKANCTSFDLVKVKGNHFVHLNDPEIVAPHINAFFKKYDQLTGNL